MHEDIGEVARAQPLLIRDRLAACEDAATRAGKSRSAAGSRSCRPRDISDRIDRAAHNHRYQREHQPARR